MSLFDLIYMENKGDLTNHDLSHLAEWADEQKKNVGSPAWKRAYALIREGADLLLRRRAMNAVEIGEEVKIKKS